MEELKGEIKISKSGKIIISIAVLITISAAFISIFYLRVTKKSEDPRITDTHKLYTKYEKMIKNEDFNNAFKVLDSIEAIYSKYDDYKNSYEVGLLKNSKAVIFITLAVSAHNDSLKRNFLDSAKFYASNSITIFEHWLKEYAQLSRNEIIIKIDEHHMTEDSHYQNKNLVDIINKRADNILKAQKETPRHLSIAYTNLGSVYQYFGENKLAIINNRKALDLWGGNKTAKNNINILIDRP